jgi:hypothetical protein
MIDTSLLKGFGLEVCVRTCDSSILNTELLVWENLGYLREYNSLSLLTCTLDEYRQRGLGPLGTLRSEITTGVMFVPEKVLVIIRSSYWLTLLEGLELGAKLLVPTVLTLKIKYN